MARAMTLVVDPATGRLQFIHDDAAMALVQPCGEFVTTRASHVEPTLDNQWTADLSPSGGPVLGPFPTRAEALAAEVRWLEENLLKCRAPSAAPTSDSVFRPES